MVSSARTGSSLVVFVATKTGIHQVIDMIIDRRITDGVITIQKGLTDLEAAALRKEFRDFGHLKVESI